MDWYAGGVRGRDTLWVRNWNNTQDSILPSGNKILDLDGNGFVQYKNGLNDPVVDNFGYTFSVLGYNPQSITFNPGVQGGIRARGGDLMNTILPVSKSALIAPFWGDMILSQYDPEAKQRDEHGMVHYKRTYTNDSLIIAFFRVQLKGTVATWQATITVEPDKRPGVRNYCVGNAYVVLSAVDSSITIHYNMTGTLTHNGSNPFYSGPIPADAVFR